MADTLMIKCDPMAPCGQSMHRVEFDARGRLDLLDHPGWREEIETEATAAALAGVSPRGCYKLVLGLRRQLGSDDWAAFERWFSSVTVVYDHGERQAILDRRKARALARQVIRGKNTVQLVARDWISAAARQGMSVLSWYEARGRCLAAWTAHGRTCVEVEGIGRGYVLGLAAGRIARRIVVEARLPLRLYVVEVQGRGEPCRVVEKVVTSTGCGEVSGETVIPEYLR